ncbi:hypothetical protein [Nocardioides houyundeii]|uniref:hypothetical protein n=1 Tax=Nocardioides houyundeii TaxID=2045452 RepID=UPI0013150ABF|nr:hypothetical protein [Nocardioides houyundeii]
MSAPRKKFVQFQPSALRSAEECERYYSEVHTVWAMQALRDAPSLVSYETNLVERQWDLLGGLDQPPDQWRFAVLRETGDAPMFTPSQGRVLAHDHQVFLRDLRRFDVEETVRFDRSSRSLAAAKYLLVLDRPDDLGPTEAASAFESLLAGLVTGLREAQGARRLVANVVVAERGSAPGREPGQIPTDETLPTRRLGFVELWFDDRVWGREHLGSQPVRRLLTDSPFAPDRLVGYEVAERVAHDRRPPA